MKIYRSYNYIHIGQVLLLRHTECWWEIMSWFIPHAPYISYFKSAMYDRKSLSIWQSSLEIRNQWFVECTYWAQQAFVLLGYMVYVALQSHLFQGSCCRKGLWTQSCPVDGELLNWSFWSGYGYGWLVAQAASMQQSWNVVNTKIKWKATTC